MPYYVGDRERRERVYVSTTVREVGSEQALHVEKAACSEPNAGKALMYVRRKNSTSHLNNVAGLIEQLVKPQSILLSNLSLSSRFYSESLCAACLDLQAVRH